MSLTQMTITQLQQLVDKMDIIVGDLEREIRQLGRDKDDQALELAEARACIRDLIDAPDWDGYGSAKHRAAIDAAISEETK